ncbi:MAG: HupE/UreJ family protein [Pseudomonadales bacterium]|nr:HupE/UreJ family protein [Pseudomonadales bacterium]
MLRNLPTQGLCGLHIMLMALVVLAGSKLHADDIPLRVAVQGFVNPEGNQLQVLLRVPMDAFGEIEFPTRGVPGSLIFSEAGPALQTAAQVYVLSAIRFYEEGRLLSESQLERVRVSLPSNRSFTDFDSALANVMAAPLSDETDLYWRQGMLDVLVTYPIESEQSRISVDPRLGGLGIETNTVLRYVLEDGTDRAFAYVGNPGLIALDPSWWQAVARFIEMGFNHILDGMDHLLFLLCLVIPLRQIKALVPVITSFTIAHSITLIASAFGLSPSVLWFPPLIETLIALSIVYMAFENIVGVQQKHRWVVTFGFGLVHGFGFSFLLTESMQFAGSHLVLSLLAFNVGVELGQLLVLVVTVPVLVLVFRHVVAERMGVILLSALVAHTAWHWMSERWTQLLAYDISLPSLNAAFLSNLVPWGLLLVFSAGVLWLMYELFNRFFAPAGQE